MNRVPLMDRFMAKVVKHDGGCWEWTAAKCKVTGYGKFLVNNKVAKPHRIAYELFVGPIAAVPGADYRGTCVMHTCDNRLCVNPAHLVLGTHADNMADKKNKGRVVSRPLLGEKHQNSKLTADNVIDIRSLNYVGATVRQLAEVFGVTTGTVYRVLDGTTWSHV